MKHIIVGGVAGGATAAARIRRMDDSAEIILIEKGKHISYANCGLPYYIGGTIQDRRDLLLQTPYSFGRRLKVDVRVENEVIDIDTGNKTVTIKGQEGKEYKEGYDKLLLSPGSVPVRPPLEGIELEGIFTLRNVEDTDKIKAYIDKNKIKRAVVVGGGFIGLEMAENLHQTGAEVEIVEMADQVMAPVDFSIASHVHRHLMNAGVKLHLGKGVEKFSRDEGGIRVFFRSGESLSTDIVLLSIGVRPETSLAVKSGLEIGARGIKVNKYLETSAKDVYAVGDAIEYNHPLTGEPWLNFLANPANRQARIVADNMVFGNKIEYEGAIGTAIAKVFDISVGSTGLPAKQLKRLGINYKSYIIHSPSHAGYYPEASFLTIKLTFDPENGKLYGVQCVGKKGVDKRVDQASIIIKHGGTIYDLTALEHCYAPPFSSAKDPLAIAGYTAENIINGRMETVSWRELKESDPSETLLLDIRTSYEYRQGSLAGAVNIPLDELRERLSEIPEDKDIVVFCVIGQRGYVAQRILNGAGFSRVKNLSGGYETYLLATQKTNDI